MFDDEQTTTWTPSEAPQELNTEEAWTSETHLSAKIAGATLVIVAFAVGVGVSNSSSTPSRQQRNSILFRFFLSAKAGIVGLDVVRSLFFSWWTFG